MLILIVDAAAGAPASGHDRVLTLSQDAILVGVVIHVLVRLGDFAMESPGQEACRRCGRSTCVSQKSLMLRTSFSKASSVTGFRR